jgi:hypothetical protein
MSPEIIAIGVTAFLQLVGLVILGWMAYDNGRMLRENGRMLEHIEGVGAATFLQGRQMKEVLEEIRRFLLTENARRPQS